MEEEEIRKIVNAVREEIKKHDKIDVEKVDVSKELEDQKPSVPCPECGGKLFDEVNHCPHCGCELEWE